MQVCSEGNLPAPGGGVAEVFRAPEETCPQRAGEHPPNTPLPPPAKMLPLATRQAAKCIPELCTRHTSPGSPRNPSPERERAGGSARPPLRSHSRRLPALAGRLFPPARTSQGLGPVRCKCLLRGDSALLPLPSRAAARGSVARAFKTKRLNEALGRARAGQPPRGSAGWV